jgi:hypothetical protein
MQTKTSSFISARAAFSALFVIASVILVVLALNLKVTQGRVRDLQKEAASAPAPDSPDSPDSVLPPSGILFTHNTLVDFSAGGGEPFINSAPVAIAAPSPNVNNAPATPAGAPFISVPFGFSTTVSLLWKSMDGGRSFIPLGTPIVRDSVPGPGGGDTHQYFDALGRFYFCDLGAACVTAAVSDDGGNTFPKVNPLACLGPNDPTGGQDDRQWIGAFGDGRGYTTVRNLAVSVGNNFHMNTTRDAGMTWAGSQQIGTVSQSGPMVVDRSKRDFGGTNYIVAYQMYYSGSTLMVFRIRDPDTGAPVIIDNLTVGSGGANVFPTIAVDTAGNLYVTWSDATAIYMVTSTDRGDTWSNVKRVSPTSGSEGTGTIIMPWVIAGDPGRCDIVWYRGSIAGNSTSTNNRWDIYMAQTLNAFATSPSFTYTKVNETNIHFGQICLGGTFCDVTVPPGTNDRSFLEFPSISIDDRGAAQITWNDNTNQSAVTAASPQVTGLPYVMFSKQLCGPSLLTNVGDVGQAGTVTITSPANNATVTPPVTVQGTHTLPPATFDKDEAGDARFPYAGPVIGTNVPALDIRQVDMTEDATNIIVHMQVADATTAALASATGTGGGDGLLYLVQWDYDESTADPIDKVFWVAAEVRAGQALGRTGTLGVIRSATSKKYVTYNPDAVNSLQVTVNISNTAPGTITLTIPRSLVGNPANGTSSLYSVTGYAMSERGPLAATPCPPAPASCENIFDPSSLPIAVDTAGAFTYVVGAGMQLDGVVQLSLDDATFAFPISATVSLNGTWQGTLSSISGGQHRVYARQVVRGGCATSLAPSILLNIPGGPPPLTGVVSRKTHGTLTPPADLALTTTGTATIECRTGGIPSGSQTLVFTFANTLNLTTPVGSITATATTSGGPQSVTASGSLGTDPHQYIVSMSSVPNASHLNVTLNNVLDSASNNGPVSAHMDVLFGDVSASARTDAGDVTQVRNRTVSIPVTTDPNSFRYDVNISGRIDAGDVTATRNATVTVLP